jgi:3-oxoacyl-(acyl-carrier-protein) synthase
MEPLAVGTTSDADHIITPSREGPHRAVELAIDAVGRGETIGTWDLHSTATPADLNEVELLRRTLSSDVLMSARKGTFGHGMSVAGGWELTAQYLGYEHGEIYPTPLRADELNDQIARLHQKFVFDTSSPIPVGLAGKLSSGIGGTNACVLSRPWPRGDGESQA